VELAHSGVKERDSCEAKLTAELSNELLAELAFNRARKSLRQN